MNKSLVLTALAAATYAAKLHSNEEPTADAVAQCVEVLASAGLEAIQQAPAAPEETAFVGDTAEATEISTASEGAWDNQGCYSNRGYQYDRNNVDYIYGGGSNYINDFGGNFNNNCGPQGNFGNFCEP
jgi:hypothetical protein